jgi:hypothetical protein
VILTPVLLWIQVIAYFLGFMIILESIDPNPLWVRIITGLIMAILTIITFVLPVISLKLILRERKLNNVATKTKTNVALVLTSFSIFLVVIVQVWLFSRISF